MNDTEVVSAEDTEALAILPKQADAPPSLPGDIVVVASNPQQMQAAQDNLIEHFTSKIAHLNLELKEAKENFTIAKDRKWKVGPWQTQVKKFEHQVRFYDKVVAALKEGYVILPNYPDLDIFAIRTTKKRPKTNITRGGTNWVEKPNSQETNSPPLGDGSYVNADTVNTEWTDRKKNPDGSLSETRMSKATAFDSVDFPFKFAKPQILEKTSQAMKALVFDDIGILPKRNIRRGDPMVIGRIHNGSKQVSFLITWFVDTSLI